MSTVKTDFHEQSHLISPQISALQLAEAIRQSKISCQEAFTYYSQRINSLNAKYNAVVTLNPDASALAEEADALLKRGECWGPLHGLPITVKDCFATQNIKTTCSFKPLANYMPEQDATIVARLKKAGAIIIGKTNLPMMALDVQSKSPLFGRANNPWNIAYTVGGSSGGSAAAVAAGLTPLCFGSDMGGSIRIPAHFCGVTGFKPTNRFVSSTGHIPPLPNSPNGERYLASPGPIASCVADLRLGFEIIAGGDQYVSELPSCTLTSQTGIDQKKIKIAWCGTFGNLPIEQSTKQALKNFIGKISFHVASTKEIAPHNFDFERLWHHYGIIFGSEVGSCMPWMSRRLIRFNLQMMRGRSTINSSICQGLKMKMPWFTQALSVRDELIASLEKFFDDWDAWIIPVASVSAFKHQRTGGWISVDGKKVHYFTATLSLTSLFNMTGHPVVTIPIAKTENNMPIGIQIVTKRWDDMRLLEIAEYLENLSGFERLIIIDR